jgi:hypothetical protein
MNNVQKLNNCGAFNSLIDGSQNNASIPSSTPTSHVNADNDIASHFVTPCMRTREYSIRMLPALHTCQVINIYMSVTAASKANKVTEKISGVSFIPN